MNCSFYRLRPFPLITFAAACFLMAVPGALRAQERLLAGAVTTTASTTSSSLAGDPALPAEPAAASDEPDEHRNSIFSFLPDNPHPQTDARGRALPAGSTDGEPYAQRLDGVVYAGYRGRPQTARDKIALGGYELINPEGLAAMIFSAGYEHGLNSAPNYGTDKGAFGERLGAAALREESQAIFTYMVFAPLFHEDARYYVEGPTVNPIHRTLYAITRPFITRSDSGHNTINGALLLGYAGSAALTPAYYPGLNRNAHDVLAVYGGSIGGAALGFFLNEFTDDALIAVHLKHKPAINTR